MITIPSVRWEKLVVLKRNGELVIYKLVFTRDNKDKQWCIAIIIIIT